MIMIRKVKTMDKDFMMRKHNIMRNLFRTVSTVMFLFPFLLTSGQTTAEIANSGPDGIFVITGMNTISAKHPVDEKTGYMVERRKKDQAEWEEIALVNAPERQNEFETRLKSWCAVFPEWVDYEKIPVEKLYKKMIATGRIDSLKLWGQVLPVRLAAGTMFLDSTIKDTLQYQYRISAVKATGVPLPLYISNPVKIQTTTSFGNLRIVRKLVDTSEVVITCAQDPGYKPVFYRVYRKGEDQKVFNRITPSVLRYSKGDTAFVMIRDTQITAGKIYSYYIEPLDYYGKTGLRSEMIRTGIYNFRSIKAPYNISVNALIPAGGIQLGWKLDKPAEIRNLNIYRSMNYDTGYVLLKKISPSDTMFIDRAVEPMKKYFYYFVMEGFFNEKSDPGVRVFGIAENRIPPQKPVIKHTEGIKKGASLEITAFNPDVKNVRIYRRINDQEAFALVANKQLSNEQTTVYTDTSEVFNGYTMLSYTVQAENTSYALSEFSDTVFIHPLQDMFPEPPDNLEVSVFNGMVNLVWDDVYGKNHNILGYNVYRRKVDKETNNRTAFEMLSGGYMKPEVNYFTDTVTVEGNTYEYQVKCVDFNATESKTGPVAVITVPVTRPVAPGGMTLNTGTDGITIEWEEPVQNGIVSYKIYRYERGTRPAAIATVMAGTSQYTDTTAQKEKLYFYYLTSVHKNGTESSPGKEEGVWKY